MGAIAYIDGLAEPNPGLGTYGVAIYIGNKKVREEFGLAGKGVTNNFAEYCALATALKTLYEMGERRVTVRSDSKLVVGQMTGKWKVKGGGYMEKLREARSLLERFESVTFEWVPREENEEADFLSRVAYEKLRG